MLETSGGETTSEEHRDALNNGAPVQGPAPTDFIEGENTNEGSQLAMVNILSRCHMSGELTMYVMVFNPEIHCTCALGIPAVRKIVGAKIVTPAIPIHSCMI